jgi:nucleotide-binding universal stress UspA family protein
MFNRIAVAYNGSPEAARALAQAIDLARIHSAELHAVTVRQDLPPYTAYAAAADSSISRELIEDQQVHGARLHSEARETALREGVKLETHLLEDNAVDAIVRFLLDNKIDLLVIGLHRHPSRISRLWSTVYEVALDAPCSVLGVH